VFLAIEREDVMMRRFYFIHIAIGILLPCFAWAHTQAPVVSRIQVLMSEIERDGLEKVTQATSLTDVDRDILRLIADVTENKSAQFFLARPKEQPSLFSIRGAEPMQPGQKPMQLPRAKSLPPYMLNAPAPGYSVIFVNGSNQILDEVVVFYQTHGTTGVTYLSEKQISPSETRVFNLGLCSQMWRYTLGVLINGSLAARIPATGNMTPDLASRLDPSDTNPCSDSWIFGEVPH
jgi:hypothetical protein